MGDRDDRLTGISAVAGVPAQHNGGVATAETEGIAGRDVDAAAASDVWNVVEVAVGVLELLIDGRRQGVVTNRQAASGNFGGATRALQVSECGFGGTDR